jgi:hypothetical protein
MTARGAIRPSSAAARGPSRARSAAPISPRPWPAGGSRRASSAWAFGGRRSVATDIGRCRVRTPVFTAERAAFSIRRSRWSMERRVTGFAIWLQIIDVVISLVSGLLGYLSLITRRGVGPYIGFPIDVVLKRHDVQSVYPFVLTQMGRLRSIESLYPLDRFSGQILATGKVIIAVLALIDRQAACHIDHRRGFLQHGRPCALVEPRAFLIPKLLRPSRPGRWRGPAGAGRSQPRSKAVAGRASRYAGRRARIDGKVIAIGVLPAAVPPGGYAAAFRLPVLAGGFRTCRALDNPVCRRSCPCGHHRYRRCLVHARRYPAIGGLLLRDGLSCHMARGARPALRRRLRAELGGRDGRSLVPRGRRLRLNRIGLPEPGGRRRKDASGQGATWDLDTTVHYTPIVRICALVWFRDPGRLSCRRVGNRSERAAPCRSG